MLRFVFSFILDNKSDFRCLVWVTLLVCLCERQKMFWNVQKQSQQRRRLIVLSYSFAGGLDERLTAFLLTTYVSHAIRFGKIYFTIVYYIHLRRDACWELKYFRSFFETCWKLLCFLYSFSDPIFCPLQNSVLYIKASKCLNRFAHERLVDASSSIIRHRKIGDALESPNLSAAEHELEIYIFNFINQTYSAWTDGNGEIYVCTWFLNFFRNYRHFSALRLSAVRISFSFLQNEDNFRFSAGVRRFENSDRLFSHTRGRTEQKKT